MAIEEQVKRVVQRVSTQEGADPAPNEQLFETGVLDSFGLPDLVAALEQEFGIKIPDSDLLPRNFSSLEQIVKFVEARRRG
jgi:acyl carrier protein